MKQIPQAVIKAGEERTALGGTIVKLGDYKGKEAYTHEYAEPVTIGYPEVYLWDGNAVQVIGGEKALHIVISLS